MLLVTVVGDARSAVRTAFTSYVAPHLSHSVETLIHPDVSFTLDGRRLGTIERMRVSRNRAGEAANFVLSVTLTDPDAQAALADCDLVPAREKDFDIDDGFRCATGGERDFAEIGTVVFEPGGFSSTLRVNGRVYSDLRDGDRFSADADFTGPLHVTASDHSGEVVRVQADSNGAFLRVNGKDGRAIVRLKAEKNGFSLVIDTTAAH
jgi:hypothetical protein